MEPVTSMVDPEVAISFRWYFVGPNWSSNDWARFTQFRCLRCQSTVTFWMTGKRESASLLALRRNLAVNVRNPWADFYTAAVLGVLQTPCPVCNHYDNFSESVSARLISTKTRSVTMLPMDLNFVGLSIQATCQRHGSYRPGSHTSGTPSYNDVSGARRCCCGGKRTGLSNRALRRRQQGRQFRPMKP